ncbi:UvrABC system protein A, partial [termite gut metagenome]
MSENKYISIKGARVNNLKNIDVNIPRNKLVVITGLSGSGKSSLAFDTLYAEGQRRYVESLSSYARQFLGRMSKPECDFIKGIPPAIAIEQKVNSRNPRSTVGTSTEIYEYLRLLYARVGKTISPVSGQEVKKHSTEDIVNCMLAYPEGTQYTVLSPVLLLSERKEEKVRLETYLKMGFSRIDINGEIVRINDLVSTLSQKKTENCFIVIDRMTVNAAKDSISRLIDSTETAMYEGNGSCMLRFYLSDGTTQLHTFSNKFEADGIAFEELTDRMFSFNSPVGACPECEGFGKVIGIDEHLVIPNRSLSVYDGAVICWHGEKMGEWLTDFIHNASTYDFPLFTPYYELTDEQRNLLWTGNADLHGIHEFFRMLEANQYKIQYRVMLARYRGKTLCPKCHGTRLKPEANYVKIGHYSISQLVDLSITDLKRFFDTLEFDEHDGKVARRILTEINNRIRFLIDVGLSYLTLNRLSNSLSGGESQRINLVTSLGSSLVGSLYILDEPSIGLHSRDTDKLIHVLRQLQSLGNTVVVVEHDEEIIR